MQRIHKPSPLLPSVQRGNPVKICVDGQTIDAFEGEMVAGALLTAGITTFHKSRKHKEPRSLYCGMGICYECLLTIDGNHAQRACITPVKDGMVIQTCQELEL